MVNEVSVARALRDVAPGSRVLAAPCCGTPETLLRELGRHAERADGLELTTGLTFGSFPFASAVRAGRLRYRTWHPSAVGRDLVADGLASYLPLRASDVRAAITGHVDVLLLRVSEPDRDGWCSTGPTASFTRAAIETARLVIAEIDPGLPRTTGDSRVHMSEIGRFVAADDPTPYYAGPSRSDPRAQTIARHVAGLMPEGATVQLGIGAVSEAVGELLGSRHDPFGPASPGGRPPAPSVTRLLGMVTEQMIPLAEASSGTALAVELLGGPKLMDWANRNSRVEMTSSDRVHDPVFLGRNPKFVSVNSAASVDLTGQVVSDVIDGRVVSGVGGSADFFEGARLSDGGLRILALMSTSGRGRPTIVPEHPAGTPVTIPRHSVDVVVTEHGVAWLRGCTLGERREALLAIAGETAGPTATEAAGPAAAQTAGPAAAQTAGETAGEGAEAS